MYLCCTYSVDMEEYAVSVDTNNTNNNNNNNNNNNYIQYVLLVRQHTPTPHHTTPHRGHHTSYLVPVPVLYVVK